MGPQISLDFNILSWTLIRPPIMAILSFWHPQIAVCAVIVLHWCSLKALAINYKPECLYSANHLSEAHRRTLPSSLGHRLLIEQSKRHWDLTTGQNWSFQNTSREANGLMKLVTKAQETGRHLKMAECASKRGLQVLFGIFQMFSV